MNGFGRHGFIRRRDFQLGGTGLGNRGWLGLAWCLNPDWYGQGPFGDKGFPCLILLGLRSRHPWLRGGWSCDLRLRGRVVRRRNLPGSWCQGLCRRGPGRHGLQKGGSRLHRLCFDGRQGLRGSGPGLHGLCTCRLCRRGWRLRGQGIHRLSAGGGLCRGGWQGGGPGFQGLGLHPRCRRGLDFRDLGGR